ncbi:MAG: Xaa-Pro dipeptidase [Wenzhouxiangellaceae bacterium]
MSSSRQYDLYPHHLEHVRAAVDQALEQSGHDALIIHSGSSDYRFRDDMPYPFMVNALFAWWVPEAVPESLLVYRPGETPQLYFYQPVDYWHSVPAPPDPAWAASYALTPIAEADAWRKQVTDSAGAAVIGDAPILSQHFSAAALNPPALLHRLDLIRTVKTPYEQMCLARANLRAARGHRAAARTFSDGQSEFAIHLAYLQATSHNDSELPYSNIIALNDHGSILHYHGLERERPDELYSFLIDAGATYQGYAADITRTYTRQQGGLFSELVTALDKTQLELVDGARDGVDYRQLHLRAHQAIATLLADSGIVRMSPEAMVAEGVSSAFFPHGLGHYLGLQVHDVGGLLADAIGESLPRPEGHPFLRLTRPLAAGNVLTIEPGLYFIPQLLQPLRDHPAHGARIDWATIETLLPYGGIRIEDDVIVQLEGPPRNLSREAFAQLE